MPACFQLYRKNDTTTALQLTDVDEEICKHMRLPVDEKKWCHNWYDTIGLAIALGMPLGSDKLRDHFAGCRPELLSVLSFMESEYQSNAFHSYK